MRSLNKLYFSTLEGKKTQKMHMGYRGQLLLEGEEMSMADGRV